MVIELCTGEVKQTDIYLCSCHQLSSLFYQACNTTMDKINFGYSIKSIPIPSNQHYLKCLLEKLNSFIRRLRWKAYFFDHHDEHAQNEDNNNYGFKSERTPPQINDLIDFEADLYRMARSVSFRKVSNPFQNKLACDVKTINSSPDLFVPADKTTNLYKVEVNNYEKLLQDSITNKYRKSNENIVRQINLEAKQLAKNLKLDNRIEQLPEKPAFITLKDHKPNFATNPKCRLINPTKSNLGKVSKHILDRINISIRESTGLQQWRNTTAVISWFSNFPNKEKCKFLSFDVIDFYPSISEKLLTDAIDFARQFIRINDDEVNIILHCRKSILFGNDGAWIKKNGSLFDVAMGSFDGAEICETGWSYFFFTT